MRKNTLPPPKEQGSTPRKSRLKQQARARKSRTILNELKTLKAESRQRVQAQVAHQRQLWAEGAIS